MKHMFQWYHNLLPQKCEKFGPKTRGKVIFFEYSVSDRFLKVKYPEASAKGYEKIFALANSAELLTCTHTYKIPS